MDPKLIFVVIGVITTVLTFGRSEEITCYWCDSVIESKCKDPFKADGVKTCQGKACTKGSITVAGVTAITRGCSPVGGDDCKDISGAKACLCSKDKCNDGQLIKPTVYNVVIGVAMATVTAIGWMNRI